MKKLALGLAVALALAVTLAAQGGMDITVTVNADTVDVVRKIIGTRQGVDPATVTDTQVRNGIVATCRDAVQAEVRDYRRDADLDLVKMLKNDLTEAERLQVRAYILSFVK